MNVQFTEEKLIQMYVEIDDLRLSYLSHLRAVGEIRSGSSPRTALNGSEVATILVGYHLSGYKNFEYYYRNKVLVELHDYFPDAPQYESFLGYIPKALPLILLWLLHTCAKAQRTNLYFIDSKKLAVCHIKREHSHKVFDGIAAKGKTSTGWFYGLKIHLVINNLGEIMSFRLTPGNVADNNAGLLQELLDGLQGICTGDKGYQSKLFGQFMERGLRILCKPKRNMRKLPIDNQLNIILNKRVVIESTFDILSSICDIEHSRHRSSDNAIVHILGSLVAYQYLDSKPKVFYPSIEKTLKTAQKAAA